MQYIDNEKVWVQYMNDGKITHIITSDRNRENYYLYRVINGKPKKTKHSSSNPLELEKYAIKEHKEAKCLRPSTSYEDFLKDIDSEPIAEMRDIKEGFGI